ncbi:MAG: N-acetylglucosamine-6-phosphate deacetylase, partial [Bacillota bacterium]
MKAYYADKIVTENGIQEKKYLLVEKGKIVDIKDDVEKNIDIDYFKDCIIAPGYIDIHTHGALGYEPGYGEEKGLQDWSQFKMEQGVTGFLPSTASIPLEKLKKAVRHIEIVSENSEVTNILGMQMEGPFFSRGEKIGAQNPDYVLDEFPEDFREFMQENNDIIKYLALDPLISDAEEVVSFCVENDIKVSAAHSEILYEDFIEKKEDGYSCLTHSFNGMVGLHHRNPGLAYPACMDQDLFSEIICDGFHVIYPMLKLFFKLKGYDKAILVTDSMVATGMAPGTSYSLGDIKVTV